MLSEAQRLRAAFVAAFPDYVTERFGERGYPLDRASVESIEEATAFLDVELGVELERAYPEQRRSPLELFRAALGIVTLSLIDAGVSPTITEPPTAEGDTYGLAPGSSSALGPVAHDAHLVWGAAKASAFLAEQSAPPTDPAILLVAADRADRESLTLLLKSPGVDCVSARNPAAVAAAMEERAVLIAFIDLAHESARRVVAQSIGGDVPTIVYGADIDDLTETGLMAQGVRMVIRHSDFIADPTRFLPSLA